MTKKSEERDWAEIISEVRSKAKSEAEEAAEEIKTKMKELVEKVRAANFHDEAEEFLAKVRKLAEDFSKSEDGPSESKTGTRKELHKYVDDEGVAHKRPPRAKGKTWTDSQKKKYIQNFKKKYPNGHPKD
ncbi:hypothetical protein [Boseongicola aestuarii]|uniref:Uncharacterized protein n=1 Tax=Boseongicola aestuarii TaxID=1470561 RepID=A0A238IVH7_9RHOB|nr:hypothetical protein [Boseongicola aestuarii]SMX22489.1 hypothetical protein BOA8489_00586 [Boseongicola aestuarii]